MSDCANTINQSKLRGTWLRVTGRVFYGVSIVFLTLSLAGLNGSLAAGAVSFVIPLATSMLGFVISMATYTIGASLVKRGERHLVASAADALRQDPRPPILYLRAFSDERRSRRIRYGNTWKFGVGEEEYVAAALQPVGPFVAIGRPGERLPPRGANRLYVDDDKWQSVVTRLLEGAAGVVIRLGRGEGLSWEFEQAVLRVPPERLVIVVSRGVRNYNAAKAKLDQVFPSPLPPYPYLLAHTMLGTRRDDDYQIRGFLHFASDWSGHIEVFGNDHTRKTMRQRGREMMFSSDHSLTVKEFSRCLRPFVFRLAQSQYSARRLSGASDSTGSRPSEEGGSVGPMIMARTGWYPDPSGRHELRWFDTEWKPWVADWGKVTEDPLV